MELGNSPGRHGITQRTFHFLSKSYKCLLLEKCVLVETIRIVIHVTFVGVVLAFPMWIILVLLCFHLVVQSLEYFLPYTDTVKTSALQRKFTNPGIKLAAHFCCVAYTREINFHLCFWYITSWGMMTLSSSLVHHFWMHPHSDQENALSLEGHSWQGSCFPINTADTSDAETKSKEKNTGWIKTTAAKHRNCGKINSYKGQSIIAVLACKYMLERKSTNNTEKIWWETSNQFTHKTPLITSNCSEEQNSFLKSKLGVSVTFH